METHNTRQHIHRLINTDSDTQKHIVTQTDISSFEHMQKENSVVHNLFIVKRQSES